MTHDYHSLFPWWWPMMMAMTVTVMVMMIMIVCKTFITAMRRPYTDTPCIAWVASKSNTEIFTADGGRPNKEFRLLTWCHRLICCPVGLRGLCGCWRAAGRRDEQGGDGDESEERQEELHRIASFDMFWSFFKTPRTRTYQQTKRLSMVKCWATLTLSTFRSVCIASRNQTSVLASSTSDFIHKCLQWVLCGPLVVGRFRLTTIMNIMNGELLAHLFRKFSPRDHGEQIYDCAGCAIHIVAAIQVFNGCQVMIMVV